MSHFFWSLTTVIAFACVYTPLAYTAEIPANALKEMGCEPGGTLKSKDGKKYCEVKTTTEVVKPNFKCGGSYPFGFVEQNGIDRCFTRASATCPSGWKPSIGQDGQEIIIVNGKDPCSKNSNGETKNNKVCAAGYSIHFDGPGDGSGMTPSETGYKKGKDWCEKEKSLKDFLGCSNPYEIQKEGADRCVKPVTTITYKAPILQ